MAGFVARQQQLSRHLQWGPTRGRKRREYVRELRDLVLDELRREVAAKPAAVSINHAEAAAPEQPEPDLFGGRKPWWVDHDS